MRHLIARAALGVALALAAGAVGAYAATTSTSVRHGDKGGPFGGVSYTAAPGEANQLTLSPVVGGWQFADPGAEISAGSGCRAAAQAVECRPAGSNYDQITVHLGDRDDDLTVRAARFAEGSLTAYGGPGADTMRAPAGDGYPSVYFTGGDGDDVLSTGRGGGLVGDAGADRLEGSAEKETLYGGVGADQLRAGGGDDVLYPGADLDADLIDGGAGHDHLSYEGATDPLRIDMARLRAAPGDVLRSIESVSGGAADDVVVGGPGRDNLSGGGGNDRVEGGAGDDVLNDMGRDRLVGGPGDDSITGWNGDDVLVGGPGDDTINPWVFEDENRSGRIDCGSGRDTVILYDAYRDVPASWRVIPSDCERVGIVDQFAPLSARPQLSAAEARWSLLCPFGRWKGTTCPVSIALRSGGRHAGSGRVTLRKRRRGTLTVRLNDVGRRLARHGGRLEVALRLRTDRGGGFEQGYPRRWTVSVPAAR